MSNIYDRLPFLAQQSTQNQAPAVQNQAKGARTKFDSSKHNWSNLINSVKDVGAADANGLNYDQDRAKYQLAAQIALGYDEDAEGNDLSDKNNLKGLIDDIYMNSLQGGISPAALRGEADPTSWGNMAVAGMKEGIDSFNEGIGRGIDWIGDTIGGGFVEATQGKEAADEFRNTSDGTEYAWIPSIAEDLALSAIPYVGIPLAAAKAGIENSDKLYTGVTGVDPITLQEYGMGDRLTDLGSAGLDIALSSVPGFGAAAKGVGKAAKAAKTLEKDIDNVGDISKIGNQDIKDAIKNLNDTSKVAGEKVAANEAKYSDLMKQAAKEDPDNLEMYGPAARRQPIESIPEESVNAIKRMNAALDDAENLINATPEVSRNPFVNAINYAKNARYSAPRTPRQSINARVEAAKEGPSNPLDRVLTFLRGEASDDAAAIARPFETRRGARKLERQAKKEGKDADVLRSELEAERAKKLERSGDNDNFMTAVRAALARNRANKGTIGPTPFSMPNVPMIIGQGAVTPLNLAADYNTDPATALNAFGADIASGNIPMSTLLALGVPGPKRAVSKMFSSPGYYASKMRGFNNALSSQIDSGGAADPTTQIVMQMLSDGMPMSEIRKMLENSQNESEQ